MRYLFLVDVQREFVKDRQGQKVYDDILKYIDNQKCNYDSIVALVFQNDIQSNMNRIVDYKEVMQARPLEFIADAVSFHH